MRRSVFAGYTAAVFVTCWLWIAGCRAPIAMAGTRWTLRERVYTLRGPTARKNQVTADAELAVSPYVQDHGPAHLSSEQHAP